MCSQDCIFLGIRRLDRRQEEPQRKNKLSTTSQPLSFSDKTRDLYEPKVPQVSGFTHNIIMTSRCSKWRSVAMDASINVLPNRLHFDKKRTNNGEIKMNSSFVDCYIF